MNMTSAPSLLDQDHLPPAQMAAAPVNARSLLDLMYDGFYALFMLKNGSAPVDEASFSVKMQKFLGDVERNAKKLDVSPEDVYAAKYAFCASLVSNRWYGSNSSPRTASPAVRTSPRGPFTGPVMRCTRAR